MARRSNTSKHPALAAASSPDGLEETGVAELTTREVWQRLTLDQKNFLGRYMMIGDGIKAARELGLQDDWFSKQRLDLEFQELISEVMDRPVDMARLLVAEMSPMSMEKLRDLMEQSTNKDVQLRAVRTVMDAVGITSGEAPKAPPVRVEVKMFGAQKAVVTTDGTVVEADAGAV